MNAPKGPGVQTFESGNLLNRAKALVPVLVPLFVSAFRRADELSIAMECRLYPGRRRAHSVETVENGRKMIGVAFAISILIFCLCDDCHKDFCHDRTKLPKHCLYIGLPGHGLPRLAVSKTTPSPSSR